MLFPVVKQLMQITIVENKTSINITPVIKLRYLTMEACRKTYVFNWTVLMYLLEEVHKWDHSTCKAQPQLELEFSKFYQRVKLIALLISTLLSDILTILGIIWTCKVFLDVFTIKLKRNNLRHELKKYMLKQALI
jgi:hypothetical protein